MNYKSYVKSLLENLQMQVSSKEQTANKYKFLVTDQLWSVADNSGLFSGVLGIKSNDCRFRPVGETPWKNCLHKSSCLRSIFANLVHVMKCNN